MEKKKKNSSDLELEDIASPLAQAGDIGGFGCSVFSTGILLGKGVSILLVGLVKVIRSGTVEKIADGKVLLGLPEGKKIELLQSDVAEVMLLEQGQKYALHVLPKNVMGIQRDKFIPFMKEFGSGKETFVRAEKVDGTTFVGKMKLLPPEGDNGIPGMRVIEASEKLEIGDKYLNVVLTEVMKQELLAKGSIKVDLDFEQGGVRIKSPGELFIDHSLNKVRVRVGDRKHVRRMDVSDVKAQKVKDKKAKTVTNRI